MSDARTGMDPGRALRCEESRVLLMGYIDGELDGAPLARLEDHLSVCVACRAEEEAYRRLGHVTESALADGVAARLGRRDPWPSIYSNIERGFGWLLFGFGLVLLGGYGMWQFLFEFLLDSEVSLVARLGVATVAGGSLLLLVSVIRERLRLYRSERYREVQR